MEVDTDALFFMDHCWAMLGFVLESNCLLYQGKGLRLCLFMYSRIPYYKKFLYCCLTVWSYDWHVMSPCSSS
jgi:hypothetical protein